MRLTDRQNEVLRLIVEHGPIGTHQLGERLGGRTGQGAAMSASSLADKGLVQRRSGGGRVLYEATPKGRQYVAEAVS